MPIDRKILAKAYRAPQSLNFEDVLALARQLQFEEVGGRGSHKVFRHPKGETVRRHFPQPLNLQRSRDGKSAKEYQVRQMLKMAEALGVISREPK
jgi:HicA toxin of bacterial toxin-antitoxin,